MWVYLSLSLSLFLYIYIYIYVCLYIYTCIYEHKHKEFHDARQLAMIKTVRNQNSRCRDAVKSGKCRKNANTCKSCTSGSRPPVEYGRTRHSEVAT